MYARMSAPRVSWLASIAIGALLIELSGCTIVNPDHCGNQSGHATCQERAEGLPYCNRCVAANDGCVAEPPSDDKCKPVEEDLDPDTGTSSTTAAMSTTEDGSGATDTTSKTESSTTPGEGDTTDTTGLEATETMDMSTGTESDGETDATETEGAVCGNGVVEGDEECDGEDFDGATCASVTGDDYSVGTLHCTNACTIYDGACCLGVGAPCAVALNDCCSTCDGVLGQCAPP
jgi:hypothetical protein